MNFIQKIMLVRDYRRQLEADLRLNEMCQRAADLAVQHYRPAPYDVLEEVDELLKTIGGIMKTKAEIKAKIKEIMHARDTADIGVQPYARNYRQACNIALLGLRYALGYKQQPYYWCVSCSYAHKNVKCPKCGNENLIERGEL